jgi:hypothetical protein
VVFSICIWYNITYIRSRSPRRRSHSPVASDAPSSMTESGLGKLGIMMLPVQPLSHKQKVSSCEVCGVSAAACSPFADAAPDDVYGGLHPWSRYRKSPCGLFKLPRDKICLMCNMRWQQTALRIAYKTLKALMAYFKDNIEEHQKFRKGTRKAIELIDADPRGSVTALHKGSSTASCSETVSEDTAFV